MLLAIPALRALRERAAGAPLTLAAQPRIGRLLTTLGVADRSLDFEALGLDALFSLEIGAGDEWPPRCAEDLRRATRIVAWFGSRDPDFVRRLTTLAPGVVVAPSVGSDRPVWEHLLDTVGGAVDRSAFRAPLTMPASIVDEAGCLLRRDGWDGEVPLVVVHPGAGGRGKRWSAAGFAAVLSGITATASDFDVVLHRGPADAEAVDVLSSLLSRRVIVLEEPELSLLAGVLSQATAYLGNDSGISHLAAALAVPSAVLFTRERLAWRPWAKHVEPQVVSMTSPEEEDVARAIAALAPRLR